MDNAKAKMTKRGAKREAYCHAIALLINFGEAWEHFMSTHARSDDRQMLDNAMQDLRALLRRGARKKDTMR